MYTYRGVLFRGYWNIEGVLCFDLYSIYLTSARRGQPTELGVGPGPRAMKCPGLE